MRYRSLFSFFNQFNSKTAIHREPKPDSTTVPLFTGSSAQTYCKWCGFYNSSTTFEPHTLSMTQQLSSVNTTDCIFQACRPTEEKTKLATNYMGIQTKRLMWQNTEEKNWGGGGKEEVEYGPWSEWKSSHEASNAAPFTVSRVCQTLLLHITTIITSGASKCSSGVCVCSTKRHSKCPRCVNLYLSTLCDLSFKLSVCT